MPHQVLTCVCPNPRLVLTGGTSSVVAVYEYNKKVKQLLIKKMLHGHTDAVICLAASPGHLFYGTLYVTGVKHP